jgi:prophage antirepressor-like protein
MDEKEFEEQLSQLAERVSKKETDINTSIKLFENKKVRTAWDEDEEEWYFSIVDVISILTNQDTQRNASTYWAVLKKRLNDEGSELLTNYKQLKLTAADGKKRLTDVANTTQLLRLIQSIPSPKAEPFKVWLSTIGADL